MGLWQRLAGRAAGEGAYEERLAAAAAKDARRSRKAAAADDADPRTVGAAHSAAAVARLPAEERRAAALRIQRRRRALACEDGDRSTARALGDAHCGWDVAGVTELWELALTDGSGTPATAWAAGGEHALHLPLAALAEIPAPEREPLRPLLRTAHVLAGAEHGGTGAPQRGRERVTARLRQACPPDAVLEALLPRSAGAYAVAARCALGPGPYEEDVVALLRWCGGVRELRPRYGLLGSAGELLARSAAAREALGLLLAAGHGEPQRCAQADAHRGPLADGSARVLGALAWAACVSGEELPVRELGRALRHHAGGPLGDRPEAEAFFLRAGLAALASLAGEPGTGRHHRVLAAGRPRALVAAAREELGLVRQAPPSWEGLGLRYELGGCTAVLAVRSDGKVTLGFRDARGGAVQRVPVRVRERLPVQYAALRVRLAEVRARVAAFRGSLSERLHADPGRPVARWVATCLDDPALEPLSRAVLWQAELPDGAVVGRPVPRPEGLRWALLDVQRQTHVLAGTTVVRLWDPHTADAAEVAAWRADFARRRVTQPVPQLAPPPA
ncbi:DUF4132 domain-containing protein [Streptomyces sp. NRRL F-5123]|uniref:DUF4132 domain-containing protein n=1 Tax=Streptomyces sp. NRRL F-5123 TaxID=1463856 RepID=UPI0004E27809|nr:DUF4132 domain-containing protein [Streptomyces sp. NRRL F-5123]